jgi:hypothetical protein
MGRLIRYEKNFNNDITPLSNQGGRRTSMKKILISDINPLAPLVN